MATPSNDTMTSLVDKFYKTHFIQEDEHIVSAPECYEDESDTHDDYNEAGLMDYRFNDINVKEKDRTIIASITFYFGETDEDVDAPYDFDEKWCAKFNAKEVAEETMGEEYNILDAFWEGTTLHMIIDNLEGFDNEEDIIDYLQNNSLEDAQFEGCPGESFWVVSYKDLKDMA